MEKKKGQQNGVEEEDEGSLSILENFDKQNLAELMTVEIKGNILEYSDM